MNKRDYCKRCGQDVTIIQLHTCLDGLQYADYGNAIYQERKIRLSDILDKEIGTKEQREDLIRSSPPPSKKEV